MELQRYQHAHQSCDIGAGSSLGFDTSDASAPFSYDSSINWFNGSLSKLGAGTLALDAGNRYSGVTTICGGTLQLPPTFFTVVIGGTGQLPGTLDLDGRNVTIASLTGSSYSIITDSVGGGVLTVAPPAGTSSTFAGTIENGEHASSGWGWRSMARASFF